VRARAHPIYPADERGRRTGHEPVARATDTSGWSAEPKGSLRCSKSGRHELAAKQASWGASLAGNWATEARIRRQATTRRLSSGRFFGASRSFWHHPSYRGRRDDEARTQRRGRITSADSLAKQWLCSSRPRALLPIGRQARVGKAHCECVCVTGEWPCGLILGHVCACCESRRRAALDDATSRPSVRLSRIARAVCQRQDSLVGQRGERRRAALLFLRPQTHIVAANNCCCITLAPVRRVASVIERLGGGSVVAAALYWTTPNGVRHRLARQRSATLSAGSESSL
jgi:hypothetical protein